MGIISEFGGLLVSGAGGGLLGLFGSGLNRVMGYFEKKADRAHDLKMAEIEEKTDNRRAALEERKENRKHEHVLKLHELNLAAQKGETEREFMLMREAGSWRGLEASHATAKAEAENFNGSVWVENYKGITRPNITYLLWVIVAALFVWAGTESRAEIISSAIFCATAATVWWFGDRAPKYKQMLASGAQEREGTAQ